MFFIKWHIYTLPKESYTYIESGDKEAKESKKASLKPVLSILPSVLCIEHQHMQLWNEQ
jgi:hypothetical protein